MEKVFIHIGLHKPVATLPRNKIFLLFENAHLLTRPYTQLNHSLNKLQYANYNNYQEDALLNEMTKFSQSKFLLSDEMLSGQPVYNQ